MPWIIHAYILLALVLLASIAGGIQQHVKLLEKPDKDAKEWRRLLQEQVDVARSLEARHAGKQNFKRGMD